MEEIITNETTQKNVPPRTCYFSGIVYCDPAIIENDCILREAFRAIAFIKHDKDKNEDGSLKEVHWHILGVSSEKHTAKTITYIIAHYPSNIFFQACMNRAKAWDYLTHKNDPDKYQYSESDIIFDCEARRKFKGLHGDNKDFIHDLERLSARQLAETYGRDYMKNYHVYRHFIEVMHNEEMAVCMPDAYRSYTSFEKDAWSKYKYLLYKITPEKKRIYMHGTDLSVKALVEFVRKNPQLFDGLDRVEIEKQKTTDENEYLNIISMSAYELIEGDLYA